MKMVFEGFSAPIQIGRDAVATLEVHDKVLFSRVCQSLLSERGEEAVEPYLVFDEKGESRSARNAFLFVLSPFDLPWEDRRLLGKVHDRVEGMILSEDAIRQEVELAARDLAERIESLGLLLRSDYELGLEWDVGKYLKSFDFGIARDQDDGLIDNLSKFLRLASDACFEKVLTFVHLKNYLTFEDIETFCEEAIFSGIQVLLLESTPDISKHQNERKVTIEQDFLQTQSATPARCPSSSQGRSCPVGFGAVTI